MTQDEFWGLIETARRQAGADVEARGEALAALLTSAQQAEHFVLHYEEAMHRAYRWDLWGAFYVLNGGCSDDCFFDAREWLIAEGRAAYEGALAHPDQALAGSGYSDLQLNITALIRERLEALGGSFDLPDSLRTVEPAGEKWLEDELVSRYPMLHGRLPARPAHAPGPDLKKPVQAQPKPNALRRAGQWARGLFRGK